MDEKKARLSIYRWVVCVDFLLRRNVAMSLPSVERTIDAFRPTFFPRPVSCKQGGLGLLAPARPPQLPRQVDGSSRSLGWRCHGRRVVWSRPVVDADGKGRGRHVRLDHGGHPG